MHLRSKWRSRIRMLVLVAIASAIPGCASWQVPRIDPSGEQVLIWPGQTPPTPPPAVAVPGGPPVIVQGAPPTTLPPPVILPPPPVVTTPAPPAPAIGVPSGNLQAPPVYPDAGVPATPPPVITVPPTQSSDTAIPAATPVTLPPPPSVDAQFAFPAPTIAQTGHPLVLTTLVSRRSDSAPLAGWTVRYEVEDISGTLGPTGNRRVEVPTDAKGRASIEISPTSLSPGQAVVNMAVVAPPSLNSSTSGSAEVGRGTSTITWRDGVPGAPAWAPALGMSSAMPRPSLSGTPYVESTPGMSAPSLPAYGTPATDRASERYGSPPALEDNYTSQATNPTPSSAPKTYAPPPPRSGSSQGTPDLIVEIRRRGPEQVEVGGFANFDLVVTNRSDAVARRIKVLDKFDVGLSHIRAKEGEQAIKYEAMKDLAPGDSATVPLTFGVHQPGRLCHHVSVTADGIQLAEEASGCITGVDTRPKAAPTLEVLKIAPTRQYVGEIARFRVVVKNTGDVPATNVVILDQYDASLQVRSVASGGQLQPDGAVKWQIPVLNPGERRSFEVDSACVSAARSACSRVIVTADGDLHYADEKCVEIQQVAGGTMPPPPAVATNLALALRLSTTTASVGKTFGLLITIQNTGQQVERDIELRVLLPQEAAPNSTLIQPAGAFQIVGTREVRFSKVPQLAPGESRQFEIGINPERVGVVVVMAQVAAAGMTAPVTKESDRIRIDVASQ